MKKHLLIIAFLVIIRLVCFANDAFAQADHVVISEIYGGGGNSGSYWKNDFIELYNPTNAEISLIGWSVQYASKDSDSWKTTELSNTIPAYGFYLIWEKAGSGGESDLPAPDDIGTISMASGAGKIALVNNLDSITGIDDPDVIDFVGYGGADEYEGSDPAPSPSNTTSIERKPDGDQGNGQDTTNNAEDFLEPGEPNPQNSGSAPVQEEEPPAETVSILINEIAWMGTVDDYHDEWVELFNNSSSTTIIDNWTLKITDDIVNLSGTILPGDYLILNDIPNLNNDGEILELLNADQELIDSTTLDPNDEWPGGNNDTKQTLERKSNGSWQTSLNPGGTPGAVNSAGAEQPPPPDEPPPITTGGGGGTSPTNNPPKANAGANITVLLNIEINFDGSESSDPDNDKLTYFWNFGDGATDTNEKTTHIYQFPGQYLVSLTVSDGKLEAIDTIQVDIYPAGLSINEFHPQQGWIELLNQGENIINLENYQLNDFILPKSSLIAPFQYLVISQEASKITLETYLEFSYPNQQLIQTIEYDENKLNWSINRISANEYVWSAIPTPGTSNIISNNQLDDSLSRATLLQNTGNSNNQIVQNQDALELKTLLSYLPQNTAMAREAGKDEQTTVPDWPRIQVNQFKRKTALPIKAQASRNTGIITLVLSIIISFILASGWGILKLKGKL